MHKYGSSIIYVILTAFSVILIHLVHSKIPVLWMLLLGTILATLYFHFINYHVLKTMYQQAWQDKRRWLQVMLVIALMWPCSFYGSSINPSIYLLIYFSITACVGLLMHLRTQQPKQYSLLIAGLGLIFSSSFIVFETLTHEAHANVRSNLMLISSGLIGGAMSFLYKKQTYLFTKTVHLKPTQVLALRFWMLIVLCLVLLPTEPMPNLLDTSNIIMIILIALSSLIVPIYFNQRGIIEAGPELNAIICGYTPALTYFLSIIIGIQTFSFNFLFFYFLSGFCIGWPFLTKLLLKKT